MINNQRNSKQHKQNNRWNNTFCFKYKSASWQGYLLNTFYKKPRYGISVVIEHGGSGSSAAAPVAKKIIKKVLDRHKLRSRYQLDLYQDI